MDTTIVELLECGHPKACWVDDEYEEGEGTCGWCEEVQRLKRDKAVIQEQTGKTIAFLHEQEESLRGDVAALHEQLGKLAVVVMPGGEWTSTCQSVGYLLVHAGGVVNLPNKRDTLVIPKGCNVGSAGDIRRADNEPTA